MKKQILRFCDYYSRGVSHHHLCFGSDSKAAKEVKSFMVEKREGSRCVLIGGCWPGEAGGS